MNSNPHAAPDVLAQVRFFFSFDVPSVNANEFKRIHSIKLPS